MGMLLFTHNTSSVETGRQERQESGSNLNATGIISTPLFERTCRGVKF